MNKSVEELIEMAGTDRRTGLLNPIAYADLWIVQTTPVSFKVKIDQDDDFFLSDLEGSFKSVQDAILWIEDRTTDI